MSKIYGVEYLKENRIIYVGQTIQSGKKRWYDHLRQAKNQDKKDAFHTFLREQGEESFSFVIIEEGDFTAEELNDKEAYYIKKYDTIANGYNILERSYSTKLHPVKKPVLWYDSNKNFMGRFASIMEASIASGVKECNIGETCNRRQVKTAKGWFYFEGDNIGFIEPGRTGLAISVDKINPFTLEIEKTYSSFKKIKEDGFSEVGARKCCNKKQFSSQGYFWKYSNEEFVFPEKGKSIKVPIAQIENDTNLILQIFESKMDLTRKVPISKADLPNINKIKYKNTFFIDCIEWNRRKIK